MGLVGLRPARSSSINHRSSPPHAQIGAQSSTGVITGNIDAVDPDELGKTVQIRSSVYAGASRCRPTAGCAPEPGLIGLSFTNPAILGGAPGDNWHAPAAVNTCAYLTRGLQRHLLPPRDPKRAMVTIDGLGTGGVVYSSSRELLLEGGASE